MHAWIFGCLNIWLNIVLAPSTTTKKVQRSENVHIWYAVIEDPDQSLCRSLTKSVDTIESIEKQWRPWSDCVSTCAIQLGIYNTRITFTIADLYWKKKFKSFYPKFLKWTISSLNLDTSILAVKDVSPKSKQKRKQGKSRWNGRLCRSYTIFKGICLWSITKTCLYNFDPLKPHFYTVKLGFTGVYIIFLISAQKHRLWVLVRTASSRRF